MIDNERLKELIEKNKSLYTYYIGDILFYIFGLVFGYFFISNFMVDNYDYKVLFRLLAASALYSQSEHYRRKVFVLLPNPLMFYFSVVASGVVYIICIIWITGSEDTWLTTFSIMMLVLFLQNWCTYLFIKKTDFENPLKKLFYNWTMASLGYFLAISLVSPITYTIKINGIKTISIPLLQYDLPIDWMDFLLFALIISSMILSALRLDKKMANINKEQEHFLTEKLSNNLN